MKNFLALTLVVILCVGCSENSRARRFGGKVEKNLPPGQKLIGVTWKESSLWVLTRPMRDDEKPETYAFQEESKWGLVEGQVLYKETK